MWAGLIQSVEDLCRTKRLTSSWVRGTSFAWLLGLKHVVFSSFEIQDLALSSYQGYSPLTWKLFHQLFWFSNLWTWTETEPLTLLSLQLASCLGLGSLCKPTWSLSVYKCMSCRFASPESSNTNILRAKRDSMVLGTSYKLLYLWRDVTLSS